MDKFYLMKINESLVQKICYLHNKGHGLQSISKELSVGRSSVYRTLKKYTGNHREIAQ